MQIKRMRLFWISVGIAALVALLALHEILLPFAVGAVAAYLLNPLVDRLERFGIKRTVSALGLVLLFAAGLAVGALIALPVLLGEVRFFFDQFPHYLIRLQSIALDSSKPWLHDLLGHDLHVEESSTDIISKLGGSWLDELVTSMWAGGLALLSLFSLVVVAPIVTIYLIIDWHRMIATVDSWIASEYRSDVHAVTREIQDTISGFVRGQILICLLLALFYTASLRAIGLDHAIVLGVTAGLISFVPYLGAATGLVLSTCVGLVQFWPDWLPVIAVAAIFAIGETIADYVLAPRVIGRRVKLSPVWLLFALSASGWLFGFVGLVVAVPLAASIRVLLQFAFQRSQAPSRIDYDAREV